MRRNVGGIERPLRMIVEAALLAIAAFTSLPMGWMIALFVLGVVALATSVIGFCPAWSLMGINTCEVETTTKRAA